MDFSYFQKINNTFGSHTRQESDLYVLNRHIDKHFTDTIDYHQVLKNGEPFELLIIRDTDSNTYKKKIKSKNGDKFRLGDYIYWNEQYWIVVSLDPDSKVYNSGNMFLCTTLIRWQNRCGEIIERWCFSEDFTKYSSGVKGNNVIMIGDNQIGLTIPVDSETKLLRRDFRFAVDLEDSPEPDIYKLTNRKVVLNNYQHFDRGGLIILTLCFDAFNKDCDRFVMNNNGKKVWICNYFSPTSVPEAPENETTVLTIEGNKVLKVGYSRVYNVIISDINGEINNIEYEWKIISEFNDKISTIINDNSIKLYVADETLKGQSFILQVVSNEIVLNQMSISISDIY